MVSRFTRSVPVTIDDVLDGHVALDLQCLDRLYLHGGYPVPSPACLQQIGDAFRRRVASFAEANHIPVVTLKGADRNIVGGQVGEGAEAVVLALGPHRPSRPRREREVDAHAGLDAGLLVGAEHVLVLAERLPFPFPLVEVQGAGGLRAKCGLRGKIHDRCCQGFRASSASQRRTVDAEGAGAMPLAAAWRASSGQVQRARGVPLEAGISRARALTPATTRAGNTRGLPGRGASASPASRPGCRSRAEPARSRPARPAQRGRARQGPRHRHRPARAVGRAVHHRPRPQGTPACPPRRRSHHRRCRQPHRPPRAALERRADQRDQRGPSQAQAALSHQRGHGVTDRPAGGPLRRLDDRESPQPAATPHRHRNVVHSR